MEAGLNVQIKSISSRTNHPWTSRIHPIVTESLDIIVNMRKAAGSLQGHSASSEELKKTYLSRALQVEQDLEKLKAERNLILQQSSISAHGPATPVPGQRMSDAAAVCHNPLVSKISMLKFISPVSVPRGRSHKS